MKAEWWRVDVIGGEHVRLVLWSQHFSMEFEPSDEMLAEMIEALKIAGKWTERGYVLSGTDKGTK